MISGKLSVVFAIIILVAFGSMAYVTIEKSSADANLSESSLGGYIKVVNSTSPVYFITNSTTEMNISFTIQSNSPTVYIYDISPLSNNTSSPMNSLNITELNRTVYPYNYMEIQNATNSTTMVTLNLFFNSSVVAKMNNTINPSDPSVYVVKIVLINGKEAGTGFGFGLIKTPVRN
ncbi:MAG: hypothetical protein ACYDAP_07060 [Thermoplasmataceae archaeon]